MVPFGMCFVCNLTSIPVCNVAGGCGPQLLDALKIVGIAGGAGLGIVGTLVPLPKKRIKNGRAKK